MNFLRDFLALGGLMIWVACNAEAEPLGTRVPTAMTASPNGGTCCFCVYPNPDEQDSEDLHNLCDSCLPVRYPDCNI